MTAKTNKEKILWIAQTAVMVALLIVMQSITASLGQTVTGSVVNLILIVAVMIGGLASGVTVALISPVMAKILGIGPLWGLIPFVALGNIVLVVIWHFIANKTIVNPWVSSVIACVVGAVLKFITLYVGIVKVAIPVILQLPEAQAAVLSTTFSTPQLLTATIGGAVAIAIVPVVKKALKQTK